MNTRDSRVSMAEIARLAGVGLPAVSNWRRRHPDFPQPDRREEHGLFVAADVAAWLDRRKIASPDLKGGEPAGTTYGQRFRRNLGIPDTSAPRSSELESLLWQAADQHKGYADPSEYGGLLLRLLYLRACDSARWADLVRASSGPGQHQQVGAILADALAGHGLSLPDVYRPSSAGERDWTGGSLAATVRAIDEFDSEASMEQRELAVAFSRFFERMIDLVGKRGGEFYTPESVVRTMVVMAKPRPDDRIHDPCSGSGDLLVGASQYAIRDGGGPSDLRVSGQALGAESWEFARMNLALHGIAANLGPHPSLALRENLHTKQRFDTIITNPPFNLRLSGGDPARDPRWRYGPPPEGNANFAWLQHAVLSLANDGRAAVLMANGASSSENPREQAIRAAMIEDGAVEGLVALPPQLFPQTGIPVSLWLLRYPTGKAADDILFIDATAAGRMANRTRRELTESDIDQIVSACDNWRRRDRSKAYLGLPGFSVSVPIQEIRERGYNLNPRAYITTSTTRVDSDAAAERLRDLHRELDDLQHRVATVEVLVGQQLRRADALGPPTGVVPSGWERIRLSDVCDITAGPSGAKLRPEDRTSSGVPMVTPRDFRDNRIVADHVAFVDPAVAAGLARYQLEAGDVLCARTGELGRQALADERQIGWLFGTACLRLRPDERLSARYLVYYLSHPAVYDWIQRNATGSAIASLSTKTLGSLPVVVPPVDVQAAIGEILGALDDKIALHDQVSRTTAKLRDALLPTLVDDPNSVSP